MAHPEYQKKTRYKIVVTKYSEEDRLTKREWKAGADPESEREDGYGYTPQVREIREVEREVLRQEIPELDLTAVIKAINNIK